MEKIHAQVISNGKYKYFDDDAEAEVRIRYAKFFAQHPSGIRDFWLTIKSSINKAAFTGDLFVKMLITPGAIRLNNSREVDALCKLIEKNEALQTVLLRIPRFGNKKAQNMPVVNLNSQVLVDKARNWRTDDRDNRVKEFFKDNPDLMLQIFSKCPTFVAKITDENVVSELAKQFPRIIPFMHERAVVEKLFKIGRKMLPLNPYADTQLKTMLQYLFPQYLENPNESAVQEIRARYLADFDFFKLAIGENFEQLNVISIAGGPVDFLEQLSKTQKGQKFIKDNIYKITAYLVDHIDVNEASMRRFFKKPRRQTQSYLKALQFYLKKNAQEFLVDDKNITYTRLSEQALKILSLSFVRKSCKLTSKELGALLNFKGDQSLGSHSHDMEKLLCNEKRLFSRLLTNDQFETHITPEADRVPTYPYATALYDMQYRYSKKTGDDQNLFEWYVAKKQDAQRAYVLATHSKYWAKVTTLQDRFQMAFYSLLIRIYDAFSMVEKSKKCKEKLDGLKVKFDLHHPLLGIRMDYYKESPKQSFDQYLLGSTQKLRSLYHLTNAMDEGQSKTDRRNQIKDVFRLMFYMATPQEFFVLCDELEKAVEEDAGLREYCIPVLLEDENFTGKYCEYLRGQKKVSNFYKYELFALLTPYQHALNMASANEKLSHHTLFNLKINEEGRDKLFAILIDPDVDLAIKRKFLDTIKEEDKFLLDRVGKHQGEELSAEQLFDLFLLNPARLEKFVTDKDILKKILADENLLVKVMQHACIVGNLEDEHLGKLIFDEHSDETIKTLIRGFTRHPELLWRIMQLDLDLRDETATKNFKRVWRGESKALIQAAVKKIIDDGKKTAKGLVKKGLYFLNLVVGDLFYTDGEVFDAVQMVSDFGKRKTDEQKAFIDDMIADHQGAFSQVQLQMLGKLEDGESHRDGRAAKLMNESFVAKVGAKRHSSSECDSNNNNDSNDSNDSEESWNRQYGDDRQ